MLKGITHIKIDHFYISWNEKSGVRTSILPLSPR